jgi:HSP20 family protein
MASFFDKLKNSMGVEIEEDEESKGKQVRKIPVKGLNSKQQAHVTQEKSDDWFEPEGELAVDVYETDEEIIIQATIAGVNPDDLDVAIENDVVTITGERANTEEEEGKNYFYQECFWGAFSRQIILPSEVDGGRAEAGMKNGVFTLRIPKIERKKLRKIKVRS